MSGRQHAGEVERGERFGFGENWTRFIALLTDERIEAAKQSLEQKLGKGYLDGRSFLDIGSGSGLFSLAAWMLGAAVHSMDYDPRSVACTEELRRRYFGGRGCWTVAAGSVLDRDYVSTLGTFDVVYSWGVLHHTGAMWQALENVAPLVKAGGKLYIAIYNTQRPWTSVWRTVKRVYNKIPYPWLRKLYTTAIILPVEVRSLLYATARGKPKLYIQSWTHYHSLRGMSRWRDMVDWVGGYPFETAKPEEIFYLFHRKGMVLEELFTCGGGLGCNEYVFLNESGR